MHCHIKYWKTKGVGRCSPSIIQHNWNEQMIWNDGKKHILLRKKYHKFYCLFDKCTSNWKYNISLMGGPKNEILEL